MKLLTACAFGLEALVKRELNQLGYSPKVEQPGRVSFEGELSDVCRANVFLRIPDRVLIQVAQFPAPDFDALFDTTKALAWNELLPPNASFPVVARSRKSQLTSVPAIQRSVKRAVVDSLLASGLAELPEDGPTYKIEAALLDDVVTLTLDTSGPSLHKRGYRKLVGPAPLKETMAAALIQLSVWNPERALVDPFCGSGTIPIEAALIGLNIAPGLHRNFSASQWPTIPDQLWENARTEARDLQNLDQQLDIIGTDRDPEVLKLARFHAEKAGVASQIHFQEKPFSDLRSSQEYGCVIANPPYGQRLEEQSELLGLYESMPSVLQRLPSWSHFILTSMPRFEKIIQKQATRRRKLFNGRIECTYYQFLGPKPDSMRRDRPPISDSNLANNDSNLATTESQQNAIETTSPTADSIAIVADTQTIDSVPAVNSTPGVTDNNEGATKVQAKAESSNGASESDTDSPIDEQRAAAAQETTAQIVVEQETNQPTNAAPVLPSNESTLVKADSHEPASPAIAKPSPAPPATTDHKPKILPAVFGGLTEKDHEQAELLGARLRKRARHLRRWPSRGVTCFRLYEKDIPEIPLVVDRYQDHLHITEYERPHTRDLARHAAWLDLMVQSASRTLEIPIENVHLKSRIRLRDQRQYEKVDSQKRQMTVTEDGLKFIINLSDYVDTGLFLDHRETRKMVRKDATDKRFLNLFAYTGSFSVYAAAGGAVSTTTVDLSKNYIQWAKQNMAANGFEGPNHQFIAEDTISFLCNTNHQFDLVVVDPPTFSNSKRNERDWDVQKDHVRLLNLIYEKLLPGATVYFSNNFRRFKLDAPSLTRYKIVEISRQTVPEDFRNRRIHQCWKLFKQPS